MRITVPVALSICTAAALPLTVAPVQAAPPTAFCRAAVAWVDDPAVAEVQSALAAGDRAAAVRALRLWVPSTSAMAASVPRSAPRSVRRAATRIDGLVRTLAAGKTPSSASVRTLQRSPRIVISYVAKACVDSAP